MARKPPGGGRRGPGAAALLRRESAAGAADASPGSAWRTRLARILPGGPPAPGGPSAPRGALFPRGPQLPARRPLRRSDAPRPARGGGTGDRPPSDAPGRARGGPLADPLSRYRDERARGRHRDLCLPDRPRPGGGNPVPGHATAAAGPLPRGRHAGGARGPRGGTGATSSPTTEPASICRCSKPASR